MNAKMPAWQEILFLNYQERLRSAVTEADILVALDMALDDTARDVAARAGGGGNPTDLDEVALQLRRRRR